MNAPLPISQAAALHGALSTLRNIVLGMACQPCFDDPDSSHGPNTAGGELQDLAEQLAARCNAIVEGATAEPANEAEAELLARMRLSNALDCGAGCTDLAALALNSRKRAA